MFRRSSGAAVALALAGLGTYSFGLVVAIISYDGVHPRLYSPVNHFISELSSITLTPKAWVLSLCLSLGSMMLCPIVYGLAMRIKTTMSDVAVGMGVFETLSVTLLGFAPVEHLVPHLIFAMSFFVGWLAMVSLFTTALWRKHSFGTAPGVILAGIGATVVTGAFLVLVSVGLAYVVYARLDLMREVSDFLRHSDTVDRSDFWPIALLEWSLLVSVYAWTFGVAVYLMREPFVSDCG